MSKPLLNVLVGTLLLLMLPLLTAASELGHAVQGLEYVAPAFVLLLAVLFGIGFATKFLVWPNISTLTGKVITGLLASLVAWSIPIAVFYWFKS